VHARLPISNSINITSKEMNELSHNEIECVEVVERNRMSDKKSAKAKSRWRAVRRRIGERSDTVQRESAQEWERVWRVGGV
jgi:hypothetical protein